MMKEIDPKSTTRAYAFDMWMNAPMPMVTLFKRLDVTRLVKISRKRGLKFNMLMCYCIGRAAVGIKEFYMLPVGGKLMQYDTIAVNTIVANSMNILIFIVQIKNAFAKTTIQGLDYNFFFLVQKFFN